MLAIHGTEDPVLPFAHGLALQAEIPRAVLLTLEGPGMSCIGRNGPRSSMPSGVTRHRNEITSIQPC